MFEAWGRTRPDAGRQGLDGGNVTHKVWRIASRARSPRVNVNVTNEVHPNRPEMAGVAGGVP
jgi:hypothetical protein